MLRMQRFVVSLFGPAPICGRSAPAFPRAPYAPWHSFVSFSAADGADRRPSALPGREPGLPCGGVREASPRDPFEGGDRGVVDGTRTVEVLDQDGEGEVVVRR